MRELRSQQWCKSVCPILIASKTSADIKTHKILIFLSSDTIFAYTLIHYLKITYDAQDNANVIHIVVIVYCLRYDDKGGNSLDSQCKCKGFAGGLGIFNAQLTESSDVKPAGMKHKVVL